MTPINLNGGTIFLREESGNIEYKINEGSYISIIAWPVTIENTNPGSSNITTVQLTENMTLSNTTVGTGSSGTDLYFICDSEYITFDGQGFIITISNITDYPGLIQNGTSSSDGKTNITIQDIGLTTSNGSTLVTEGGWVAQTLFGKGISNGAINVNKCYSTGDISVESGGIMGKESLSNMNGGSITISECYSTGNINESGGGIFGRLIGFEISSGTIIINECYSTGSIGVRSGGITGRGTFSKSSGGALSIENCYSIGQINTEGGGICGFNVRFESTGGTVGALNCYTVGTLGTDAGGIYGSNNGGSITNCISTDDASQPNNKWVKANADSTIGDGSTAWLDLTNSDGTPWVFNSYNAQLYDPNSDSSSSNSYTTNAGLFTNTLFITYTYQLVTVEGSYTIPSGITITSASGEINYLNLDEGEYDTKVITGQSITRNGFTTFEHYEINNFDYIQLFTGTIKSDGGTIYLREESGSIEYSFDNSSYATITSWPVIIENTNPGSSNVTTVQLTENITLSNTTGGTVSSGTDVYFICGSEYITFDGQSYNVTIKDISNWLGVIENGRGNTDTITQTGFSNIIIKNINILSDNSSMSPDASTVDSGGWLCRSHYGNSITEGSLTIEKCTSNGNIGYLEGGLIGPRMCIFAKNFTLEILECSSSGNISTTVNLGGGGITGYRAFQEIENATITMSDCYSNGIINANAGGIFGQQSFQEMVNGRIFIFNCYSTGNISGQNSGGIFGIFGCYQMSGGSINVSGCYSTGDLSGDFSGGIFGNRGGYKMSGGDITVFVCYSTGKVEGIESGGIFGYGGGYEMSDGDIIVSNCYSIGIISGQYSGGIFGREVGYQMSDGSITVSNCYSTGIISGQYSGGIFGFNGGYQMSGGSITVSNCYSTGELSGESVGGIVGRSFCDSMNNSSILNTIKNCYSIGNITNEESGGICAGFLASNALIGKLSIENCYSLGKIEGEKSGGIIGSNSGFNADMVTVFIELKNSYSVGSVTGTNAGGIYGPNISIGEEINCIAQENDTWVDENATSTIGTSSTAWIDLTNSDGTPWVLNSYNAILYNPDNITTKSLNYTTNPGLFTDSIIPPITYTYQLITVNNNYTIPSGITIDSTSGEINYINLFKNDYDTKVITGQSITANGFNTYEHYEINNFNFKKLGVPSPLTSIIKTSAKVLYADGYTRSNITVQLKDGNGDNITEGGYNVKLFTNLGSLTNLIDNQNGTYSSTYISGLNIGTAVIRGKINNQKMKNKAYIQLILKNNIYFDIYIIPEIFKNTVYNRDQEGFIEILKRNPYIAKQVFTFLSNGLKITFINKKEAKDASNLKVPWELSDNRIVIMTPNQQVNYYQYVIRSGELSNYGYMTRTIQIYLNRLTYVRNLYYQKINISKYYYLGLNIKNDQMFITFIELFLNITKS